MYPADGRAGPVTKRTRSRHRALRSRLGAAREDSGQTVVMFAFAMVALLGFMSLVFDAGAIMQERRELQNAADGAALAAARHLPDSPAAARQAAEDYLAANGYDPAAVDVAYEITIPYDGDSTSAEVVVRQLDQRYLFARVLGKDTFDVSARAVSHSFTTFADDYAVFAIDESCGADGVTVSGSGTSVDGLVHANANVTVSGTTHHFDPAVTFGCDFAENGFGHSYERGVKNAGQRDVPAFVQGLSYGSFGSCDFTFSGNVNLKSKNDVWLDAQKTLLVTGLYCFNGNVSLSGDDITGNVTFVAKGQIDVSGSDHQLTAYDPSGVLFYSEANTGGSEIDLAGSGGAWTGLVYAANGTVSISGQANQSLDGSVIGQTVELSGAGLGVSASTDATNGSPVVRLIE